MDLTYRILWFDDQPKLVDGYRTNIETRLSTIGLKLKVKLISDFSEKTIRPLIENLGNHCPYDLIMVDYDLGEGFGGETLLRKLRFASYGEMVFYSSNPPNNLREKLMEQNVDGVYCMHRQEIGSSVTSIVQSALKKILHPNYMRGLVVGSVSELDTLFSDIILALSDQVKISKEELSQEIASTELKYLESETDKKREAIENGRLKLDRQVKKANLHIKTQKLIELLELEGSRLALDSAETLRRFMDEVNTHRISFAHARTVEINEMPVFQDKQEKIWGPQEMKDLLLKIRTHKDITTDLHKRFLG